MVTETTCSKTPGLSRINPRAFLPQDFIKLSLQADCPSPLQDSVSWSLPGHCRHPFAPVRKAGFGCVAVCVCVCVCVCVYACTLPASHPGSMWHVCCVSVCVSVYTGTLPPPILGRKAPSMSWGSRLPNAGAGLEEQGTQVRKEASAPQGSQRPRSWRHTPRRRHGSS